MASIQTLPIFILNFNDFMIINWNSTIIYALLFTVIGATLFTYVLSNWAVANIGPEKVALFIYLQPVIKTFSAWKFLKEEITVNTIISSLLILSGMIIVLLEKTRKRKTN